MPEPIPATRFTDLPVFPLPGVVLFPGTVIPLHIFEPRYVQMIEDALAADGCIAIVMLRDGAALGGAFAVESTPTPVASIPNDAALCEVACAGRVIHAERLESGRFNILVQGMTRVSLVDELPRAHLYRRFSTRPLPEPTANAQHEAAAELARLQSSVLALRHALGESHSDLVAILNATEDPIALADILGAVFIGEPQARQELLSTRDLKTRLSTVVDRVADVMVRVAEPQALSRLN